MNNCNCKGWQEGHEQIVAAWAFCANHSGGPVYTGPFARFCPWCSEWLGEGDDPRVERSYLATQAKTLLTDLATDLEKAADSVYRQQAARLSFAARAERLLGEQLLGELAQLGDARRWIDEQKCKP